MAGRAWIDEAGLIAESPAIRARVAKELAARLTASQAYDEAREVLERAGESAPAEVAAQIEVWKKNVDDFQAAGVRTAEARATESQNAYVETLRRRRQRAADAGDTESVQRYENLINAAAPQER